MTHFGAPDLQGAHPIIQWPGVHSLPLFAIHKRVQELKREIADIRAASQKYHSVSRHSTLEINQHLQRELRLQEILGELAMLTKKNAE